MGKHLVNNIPVQNISGVLNIGDASSSMSLNVGDDPDQYNPGAFRPSIRTTDALNIFSDNVRVYSQVSPGFHLHQSSGTASMTGSCVLGIDFHINDSSGSQMGINPGISPVNIDDVNTALFLAGGGNGTSGPGVRVLYNGDLEIVHNVNDPASHSSSISNTYGPLEFRNKPGSGTFIFHNPEDSQRGLVVTGTISEVLLSNNQSSGMHGFIVRTENSEDSGFQADRNGERQIYLESAINATQLILNHLESSADNRFDLVVNGDGVALTLNSADMSGVATSITFNRVGEGTSTGIIKYGEHDDGSGTFGRTGLKIIDQDISFWGDAQRAGIIHLVARQPLPVGDAAGFDIHALDSSGTTELNNKGINLFNKNDLDSEIEFDGTSGSVRVSCSSIALTFHTSSLDTTDGAVVGLVPGSGTLFLAGEAGSIGVAVSQTLNVTDAVSYVGNGASLTFHSHDVDNTGSVEAADGARMGISFRFANALNGTSNYGRVESVRVGSGTDYNAADIEITPYNSGASADPFVFRGSGTRGDPAITFPHGYHRIAGGLSSSFAITAFGVDSSGSASFVLDTFTSSTVSSSRLLSIRNSGTEKAYVDKDGGANFPYIYTAGPFLGSSTMGYGIHQNATNTSLAVGGRVNSGTAVKIGNLTGLSSSGDKIASFYSDAGTTERAYVDLSGGLYTSSSIEVSGSSNGLILTAPNGSRWRFTVNNSGVLSGTSI